MKARPRCEVALGHAVASSPPCTAASACGTVHTARDLQRTRPPVLEAMRAARAAAPDGHPILSARRTLFMVGQAEGRRYYHLRRRAVHTLGAVGRGSVVLASACLSPGSLPKGSVAAELQPCSQVHPQSRVGISADTAVLATNLSTAALLDSAAAAAALGSATALSNCCLDAKWGYDEFLTTMAASNFSLMMRVGDPGSSRVADAVATDTVQMVISGGFFRNYAPVLKYKFSRSWDPQLVLYP